MSYEVAVEKMRDDAKEWTDTAFVLGDAATAAASLTLTERSLSFAGRSTGLVSTYQQMVTRMVRLLEGGNAQCANLATTLYDVARAYEENDANAAKRLGSRWTPKP
jgi:hypothetical protein